MWGGTLLEITVVLEFLAKFFLYVVLPGGGLLVAFKAIRYGRKLDVRVKDSCGDLMVSWCTSFSKEKVMRDKPTCTKYVSSTDVSDCVIKLKPSG